MSKKPEMAGCLSVDLSPFVGERPAARPARPQFSCGPTAKRPGWTPDFLASAPLGRNHRSGDGAALLRRALDMMRDLLELPADYRIAIVPGSDTGAVEMALWSLLGARGVDVLAWEAFGHDWVQDVVNQLQIPDRRIFSVDYGDFPDLEPVDTDRDVIFTWNGTTSGVKVPHADWIGDERKGLIIADATSAVYAMPIPVDRLDVITFSWQKALGGEAAHGILILSPRALERLNEYTPPWPMPKLFDLTRSGVVDEAIFAGSTINTPSLMCVADAVDALDWAARQGGLGGLYERVERNRQVLDDWLARRPDMSWLAKRPETISSSSLCLIPQQDNWPDAGDKALYSRLMAAVVKLLEDEAVAYDTNAYRLAPPGLRLWAGPTVEAEDMALLMPWLDWALDAAREWVLAHGSSSQHAS